MGYGDEMIHDLQETINRADVDIVISATPIDLTRIIKVN
jgi:predicted GTPase